MSNHKIPKIGSYGPLQRALQRRLSYERVSLTWKTALVYRYLGSRRNSSPSLSDIDDIFLSVADRAYDTNPIEINVWYEPLSEAPMNLSRFGIIDPLQDSQLFKVHINSFDSSQLGRYLVPGDVLEIPFLAQDGKKTFFEIEDVDRKTEFENYYVVINAKPIKHRQETAEISDIPTNAEIIDALAVQNEDLASSYVSLEGVNSNITGYIALGYFVDGYIKDPQTFTDEVEREDYDPRHKEQSNFLDDPNVEIF